jgi:hypothetical protein
VIEDDGVVVSICVGSSVLVGTDIGTCEGSISGVNVDMIMGFGVVTGSPFVGVYDEVHPLINKMLTRK